jgi:TolA-binding protein
VKKDMKKTILYGFITLSSLLYGYEPSVYGAGDMNSATPYGLTKTEQAVLENKKTLQMLYNTVKEQQRKIEGLTTVIDGQNKEILSLKEQLEVISNKPEPVKEDTNQTYSLLLELGQMIDNINNTYVSRDELKKVLAESRVEQQVNITPSISNSQPIQGNSADIYREGVQFFSQRNYNAAREHFLETLSQNYKSASSNYYLGEIAYYTHKYNDAVAYYKQSASLYDKASYMAVLYLHTAISLDKGGEKEQAQGFYQYVMDNYPNTKASSIAKKRSKLK